MGWGGELAKYKCEWSSGLDCKLLRAGRKFFFIFRSVSISPVEKGSEVTIQRSLTGSANILCPEADHKSDALGLRAERCNTPFDAMACNAPYIYIPAHRHFGDGTQTTAFAFWDERRKVLPEPHSEADHPERRARCLAEGGSPVLQHS